MKLSDIIFIFYEKSLVYNMMYFWYDDTLRNGINGVKSTQIDNYVRLSWISSWHGRLMMFECSTLYIVRALYDQNYEN